MPDGILKHGIGYDLVVHEQGSHLILGIRCHKCDKTSYNRRDVSERYCGHCHMFHEKHIFDNEA